MGVWQSGLMHQTVNLAGLPFGGSNPSAPTLFYILVCGSSTMVVLQPSKLATRVRFPSPAYVCNAEVAQW